MNDQREVCENDKEQYNYVIDLVDEEEEDNGLDICIVGSRPPERLSNQEKNQVPFPLEHLEPSHGFHKSLHDDIIGKNFFSKYLNSKPDSNIAMQGSPFETTQKSPKRPLFVDPTDNLITNASFKRPRTNIPSHVKMEIIDYVEKNPLLTQTDIAQLFGIDRTTVSKIIKKYGPGLMQSREHLLLQHNKGRPRHHVTKLTKIKTDGEGRQGFFKEMLRWYTAAKTLGEPITVERVLDIAAYLFKQYPSDQRPLSVNRIWAINFLNKCVHKNGRSPKIMLSKKNGSCKHKNL